MFAKQLMKVQGAVELRYSADKAQSKHMHETVAFFCISLLQWSIAATLPRMVSRFALRGRNSIDGVKRLAGSLTAGVFCLSAVCPRVCVEGCV